MRFACGGIQRRASALAAVALIATGGLATACSAGGDSSASRPAAPGRLSGNPDGARTSGFTYQASGDARIAACAPDADGYASARVVATNHSEFMSDYMITVEVLTRAGEQIGYGDVAIVNLGAGRSSPSHAVDSGTSAPAGGYTCRLSQVNRFISTG